MFKDKRILTKIGIIEGGLSWSRLNNDFNGDFELFLRRMYGLRFERIDKE